MRGWLPSLAAIAVLSSAVLAETVEPSAPHPPRANVKIEKTFVTRLPGGQISANADEVALAETRLFESVPDDVESYFDLFLYVSKARDGALAQRMFIFERGGDGIVRPTVQWLVSTGREKREKYFTSTPEGVFKVDRDRLFDHWHSRTWDAPMPYTMFLDFVKAGRKTGIAIHGTTRSHFDELGTRASGGCIRLHPEHAKALLNLMRQDMMGLVPVFAFDTAGETTARDGAVVRTETGTLQLQPGLKVLLLVENFEGGPEPVLVPVIAFNRDEPHG